MKVLLINGSSRLNGNTAIALNEMQKEFLKENIETEILNVGILPIRGCMACGYCHSHKKCVIDDIVNEASLKLKDASGLVIASPVYYASANGTLISFLDRLFYSKPYDLTMKVGASVCVARRGGASATFDMLNKYFTISNMPIASSQYWNSVHGLNKGEAIYDLEGLQTMRTLARNMIFLMKSIELGKKEYGLPLREKPVKTNFINEVKND